MRHLSAVLLSLFAVFGSMSALAQDKAVIMGRAQDQNGNPLSNLPVLLHNDALKVNLTTTTEADGSYLFTSVTPADGYIICIPADPAPYKNDPTLACVPSDKLKFKENPLRPFFTEVGGHKKALPPFMELPESASKRENSDAAQAIEIPGGGVVSISAKIFRGYFDLNAGQDGSQNNKSSPGSAALPPGGGKTANKLGSPSHKSKVAAEIPDSVVYSTVPLEYISTEQSSVIAGGSIQEQGILANQGDRIQPANELRGLPFFNRNFLVLGLLAPSTHDVPAGSELQDTTFSISGTRPTTNLFLLDGMDNTSSGNHQAIPFQVNDAIQEFRVVTATADAQFGNNLGGIVNVITQRGSSQFHGSLFGYFASDSLDASSPLSVYGGSGFDQAAGFAGPVNAQAVVPKGTSPIPIYEPLNYNQYVATVQSLNSLNNTTFCTAPNATYGSADCLQRFSPAAVLAANDSHTQPFSSQQFGGRAGGSFAKKWYWFGDYEGTRIDNPNPTFERVPSSYDRTQWSNIFMQPGQQGYADAKLAQNILALYPQANVQAIPNVLEFYRGQAPNYTNVSNYLGRLDFDQSGNTSWTARYNLQQLNQLHDDTLPSSQSYPGNGAVRDALNQNAVLTLTHRFSDRVTNELRGGFTRFQVTETPQDANFNASQIGLPNGQMHTYLLSGLDTQYAGATPQQMGAFAGWNDSVWVPASNYYNYSQSTPPIITPSLDGLFPFARIGAPLSAPGERQDSEIEIVDNLVVSIGKHLFRTGLQIGWLQNLFNNSGFSRGFVVSSNIGEFTTDSESGSGSIAPTFANPSFDYAMQQNSAYNTKFHSYTIGGYFQDTWRIKPTVTLNLGLRYEFFSTPSEYNHNIWNFDPVANGLVKQDSTQVVNGFGDACGSGQKIRGFPYLLYPNPSFYPINTAATFWNCQTSGQGNFLVSSKTNFEPRVGIAWSTPNGDTVLRAGFGIFYDRIPAANIAALGFNRPTTFSATNPQAIYDQNANYFVPAQSGLGNSSLAGIPASQVPFQAASIPFGLNAIDPNHFSNPMTKQASASIQRQVTRNLSAEVGYVGNFMSNLPVSSDTNFNNEWFCTSSKPFCDPFSVAPIFTLSNQGFGNYNALLVRVRANAWHGLQVQGSYTYSKALDNGSSAAQPLVPVPLLTQTQIMQPIGTANPVQYGLGQSPIGNAALSELFPGLGITNPFGIGSLSANLSAFTGLLTQGLTTTGAGQVHVTPYTVPQDPYNFLRNDYGRSDYDQTNRFVLEYTWSIPSQTRSIWLDGWMISGVFTAESGQPFTIFSGPVGGELDQRVNLAGPVTTTGNPNAYIGNVNSIQMASTTCSNTGAAYSPYVLVGTSGLFAGKQGVPCLGSSGRNQFTGPAYIDYDMAIQKAFRVKEAMSLVFRVESYNLLNRSNYYNPISTYSLDGASVYSQFGQIKSAHNPRQFQFAARFNW